MQLLRNEKFMFFLGGLAAAVVGKKALKSNAAHKLCVQGLAAGMKLQKDALEKFQNIKEEATDLYEESNKPCDTK